MRGECGQGSASAANARQPPTRRILRVPKAYVVSDVTLNDAVGAYRELAAASITLHGGRYVVRGGEITVLEGDWRPKMPVIAEFSSRSAAEAWYRSTEYAQALAYRDAAPAEPRFFLFDYPWHGTGGCASDHTGAGNP